MMRPVLVLLLAAACGTDPVTPPTGSAGGQGGGEGAAGGAGPSAGGGGSLPVHPGVLVDEGLVARYYLDEAASGQDPTEAIDAAPNPLPLAITYLNDGVTLEQFMVYTEDPNGNRGLSYSAVGHDDRLTVDVDGTKLAQMIHGRTTITYEVVADIIAVISDSSRLIHIGFDTDHTLSFEASNPHHLQLEVNSLGGNQAAVYWPVLGRRVFHAVLDTSDPILEERARIYVDGSRHPTVVTTSSLTQNLPIDLGTGKTFVIGNRLIGVRTIQGAIYYAAVYNVAMTPEQVAQNAALLVVDDDTPR